VFTEEVKNAIFPSICFGDEEPSGAGCDEFFGKRVVWVSCKEFEGTELQSGDLGIVFRIGKGLTIGLFENGIYDYALANVALEEGRKCGAFFERDFNHVFGQLFGLGVEKIEMCPWVNFAIWYRVCVSCAQTSCCCDRRFVSSSSTPNI